VLLVDDVADLRFLLRVVLETDGSFEVIGEAGDGQTAMDLCERTRPDVIILDLSMPTMDGLEALPELRKLAPDATIVVLSGFDKGRIGTSAASLGADGYFEKGTPPATVLGWLKETLGIVDPPAATAPSLAVLASDDLNALEAHDLRSPLTAIIGFGETLSDHWDAIDDGRRRTLVERITVQARTLRAIAENVLVARKVDLDEVEVELRTVAPAALLTDLAERVAALCGEHDIDVQVAPDLPPVLVDEQRFLHVILNLVSNAARHAPEGTTIGLKARADGAWVAVDVCDSGPGIPYADRVRVLDKHVRLSRDPHGLGLGLFVAATLCRAMGGTIAIADNDGVGTRVVCRLRVAEPLD
jgi:signal transduction histidine kinase